MLPPHLLASHVASLHTPHILLASLHTTNTKLRHIRLTKSVQDANARSSRRTNAQRCSHLQAALRSSQSGRVFHGLSHTLTHAIKRPHTHAHALSRAAPQTHSHPPSYAHTHARIKKPAAHISLLQLLLTGLVLDLSIVLSVSLLTYCACCCWKAFSIVRAWTRARCWSRFHLLRTAWSVRLGRRAATAHHLGPSSCTALTMT